MCQNIPIYCVLIFTKDVSVFFYLWPPIQCILNIIETRLEKAVPNKVWCLSILLLVAEGIYVETNVPLNHAPTSNLIWVSCENYRRCHICICKMWSSIPYRDPLDGPVVQGSAMNQVITKDWWPKTPTRKKFSNGPWLARKILVGVIGSLAEPAGQLRSRRRTMTHLGIQDTTAVLLTCVDILIECLSMYYLLVI